MLKKFNECKKANLEGLEEKLFSSRIEALQYLQKLNPKKVITYDRRCSEINIDGNTVAIQFRKQNNCFRFYVFSFYDESLSNRWDDYVGRY